MTGSAKGWARGGRADAELDTLMSLLTPEQKQEAQRRADAFTPETPKD